MREEPAIGVTLVDVDGGEKKLVMVILEPPRAATTAWCLAPLARLVSSASPILEMSMILEHSHLLYFIYLGPGPS